MCMENGRDGARDNFSAHGVRCKCPHVDAVEEVWLDMWGIGVSQCCH